jgi:hypothetical protein
MLGPDQLVLRFPLDGGSVRAYPDSDLDSLLWSSSEPAPAITRVLAFGDEAGSVTAVDAKGTPVRVDLRLGSVTRESSTKLTELTSPDGWTVYGIDAKGRVREITPSGAWRFTPPSPADRIFPDADGSLLVLGASHDSTIIWHVRPPDSTIVDTVVVPRADHAVLTAVGDRLFLAVKSTVVSVRTRGLVVAPAIELNHEVRALAVTPSGDRVYVATDSTRALTVIDRYRGEVAMRIPLPGNASALRMDATGRYVLVRAADGDSVWVVAVGTDRVLGTVETAWRDDLPTVTPNGEIALVHGKNVVLVDGSTLTPARTVRGGADDAWLFIAWNGFRPPSADPDEGVAGEDSNSAGADTMSANTAMLDTTTTDSLLSRLPLPQTPMRMTDTLASPMDSMPAAAQGPTFTVQFAAVRSAESAEAVVRDLTLGSIRPHIDSSAVAGVMIYRVVVGPFATRAEAEQIGRAAAKPYWIYEGRP